MVQAARRGKLKIYIGMAAGVGKTYRMLLEAEQLRANGIDVAIGYVEAHGRAETAALTADIPNIPRKKIFYKGKELEEMDVDAVILQKPAVALVDELAHTNIPGSRHEKRWQDVIEILDAGISVISTVNIQHIESINQQVEKITGVKINERVPDRLLQMADEVVNVDLTIEELLDRLKAGKIYDMSKVAVALNNFFQKDRLLQLRDLALKEVAHQVERKIVNEIPPLRREKLNAMITAISTNYESGKRLIRKSSRLASLYNSKWYVVYVQTDREASDRVDPKDQRHLINNFKLATELGAEVVKLKSNDIARSLVDFAGSKEAGLIVIGKPNFSLWRRLRRKNLFKALAGFTTNQEIDILLVATDENHQK